MQSNGTLKSCNVNDEGVAGLGDGGGFFIRSRFVGFDTHDYKAEYTIRIYTIDATTANTLWSQIILTQMFIIYMDDFMFQTVTALASFSINYNISKRSLRCT